MMTIPNPPKAVASSVSPAAVPWLLDLLGTLAAAAGALAAVLLLVEEPFDGPWRLVLAVAVVFVGLHVGFLMIGFAAELRANRALKRRLADSRPGNSP